MEDARRGGGSPAWRVGIPEGETLFNTIVIWSKMIDRSRMSAVRISINGESINITSSGITYWHPCQKKLYGTAENGWHFLMTIICSLKAVRSYPFSVLIYGFGQEFENTFF